MAEEEKREGEAAATETTESTDTGFSNRRLHNYPLIRVRRKLQKLLKASANKINFVLYYLLFRHSVLLLTAF